MNDAESILPSPKRRAEAAFAISPEHRRRTQQPRRSLRPADRLPSHYAPLFGLGVVGLAIYFLCFNPYQKPQASLWLATAVVVLACLPIIQFLRRGHTYQVPALEAHAFFYALCFGLPGFLALPEMMSGTMTVDEPGMQRALLATLVGLLSLYAGYYLAGRAWFKKVQPRHHGQQMDLVMLHPLAWVSFGGGLALTFITRHYSALGSLGQVARMVYELGFFGLVLLVLERRTGPLTGMLVYGLLLPMVFLLNSGLDNGQLAGGVTLLCWLSVLVMRTRNRVPVELLVFAFLFFLILQPVKFYVRNLAWGEGLQLGPVQTIQAYVQGFSEVYGSAGNLLKQREESFNNSFTRINHLATTAAILHDTPSRQNFIYGASYLPLLTKWIPRALWPTKPEERFGNNWAQRYGYLGENDTTTSFNLPWLPEMFMNFGWAGVVGVMFLLGLFYRYVWQTLLAKPQSPVTYTIAIVLSQSVVIAESNLSLQLGAVIIFAMALWFIGKGLLSAGIIPPAPSQITGHARISARTNRGCN